jgi:transporter family-2 protein
MADDALWSVADRLRLRRRRVDLVASADQCRGRRAPRQSDRGVNAVFFVGTAALAAITSLFLREEVNFGVLKTMPLHILLSGGLLGAMYVTASLMLAPRIGVAALIALGITGQLIAALLLDRFGMFGLIERELSLGRVGGALLVVGGSLMVRYL